MKIMFRPITTFLGVQLSVKPAEQIVSSIGGFISIYLIFYVGYWLTDIQGAASILPSMGAATVLLFGLPSGPLSQPWALFAGNLISAATGVFCYQWIDNLFFAASAAVGLSIAFMFIFRCLHPPGGATALAAVIGGQAIHDLGYYYVLAPTLVNCVIIFSVALIFNNLFGWRRYPTIKSFSRLHAANQYHAERMNEAYIQNAITEWASIHKNSPHALDTSTLKNIFDCAMDLREADPQPQLLLEIGGYYSNDDAGFNWAVREIHNLIPNSNPRHNLIIYRTLEGKNKYHSDSCTMAEFKHWAKSRVILIDRSK